MKGVKRTLTLALALCLCAVMAAPAWARSLKDIQQSMIQRAPVISQLKASGIVGESNRGYLAWVGSAQSNPDVVAAENADRKLVYSYFAKQQNTTLDVVEQVQGQRKAAKAGQGEFVQNPDGSWARK